MQFFKDITVRKMMLSILVFFVILWGCVSTFSIVTLSTMRDSVLENQAHQESADMLLQGTRLMHEAVENLLLGREMLANGDQDRADKSWKKAREQVSVVNNLMGEFNNKSNGAFGSSFVDSTVYTWKTVMNSAVEPLLNSAVSKDKSAVYPLMVTLQDLDIELDKHLKEMSQRTQNDNNIKQILSLSRNNMIIIFFAIVLGAVTLIISDRYLVNYLWVPVNNLKIHLEKLTDGKLSEPLPVFGKNCVGQLYPYISKMQQSLADTVSLIRTGSYNVLNGASEIRMGNDSLSSRTEQQVAALQQTAASMEEISATVTNNVMHVRRVTQLTEEATEVASRGGTITQAVSSSMEEITASSRKIAEITKLINGISFQTNILALNAAVEAARAGETGRGFAVVAGEVRNLAQRSATAAKEIETLISESVMHVDAGAAQVRGAGEVMSSIIHSITQVKALMSEISVASEEQNIGIGQISTAVSELDSVTQQNSSLVELAAAAASALENEARILTASVSTFDVNGFVRGPQSIN
jgi:methyl-accepting chemotaxis protein